MNLMDVYLQQHQLTRYDIEKRGNVSQQTLYSANKKSAASYSAKVLMALSKGTGDSPGEVLDALIKIENEGVLYQVFSIEELQVAVENKINRFLVVGPFIETIKDYKKAQLSDEERLGFDLGSHGYGGLAEMIVNQFWILFDKNPDKEALRLKDKVIKLYDLKLVNKQAAELTLKILDY